MPDVRLSVIIPVYNRAELIARCIESVRKQTLEGVEIICVDDGSTDNTVEVITELMESDPYLRLVSQQNSGPGEARNNGIRIASGKYIAFLDSDDRYEDRDALKKMVSACESKNVNVCGSRFSWNQDGNVIKDTFFSYFDKEIREEGRWVSYEEYQYDAGFWAFIYKKDILIEPEIAFPPYRHFEDPVFFMKVMRRERGFWFIPVHLLEVKAWVHDEEREGKNISDILQGIYSNLQIALENDYRILYERLINRLDVDFRNAILENMSFEVLEGLVGIERYNRTSRFYKKIHVLDDIYNTASEIIKKRKADAEIIPEELKIRINSIGINRFKEFFAENRIASVVIYGVGRYGNAFYHIALDCGIEISGLVDRNAREYDGIQVLSPGMSVPECDAVIVTPHFFKDITAELSTKINKRIIAFEEILSGLENLQ